MIERRLKPIQDKDSWWEEIASEITTAVNRIIYNPLLEALDDAVASRNNSRASLKLALESGRVRYTGGKFVGIFSSPVSKALRSLGATWDKIDRCFTLHAGKIPSDVYESIDIGEAYLKRVRADLEKALTYVDRHREQVLGHISIGTHFEKIEKALEAQFAKTVRPSIEINPEMNEKMRAFIRDEYIENTDYYLSQWLEDACYRLKTKVSENVLSGFRAETLADIIRSEGKVSERKAIQIARQETALMSSKYKQIRYKEAGVERYQWSTSGDERVRKSHKELDGTVHTWDNPPVVDSATQRRAHPREDYGCRCIAIPLLRMQEGS